MAELAEAYEEAYSAALESVSGQYGLWDEAAKVVETSAWAINNALESQTKYWQNYNTNLESLTERSSEIEGLSELIATFADGSEESVNAIAGMANATDTELATMVDNWQALKKEQETVAGSLAELETDFTASMETIQTEMEAAIEEMNLSDEAAQSGRSTVEGFINGSEDMLPAVRTAYTNIANAAVAAIDAQLKIKSPSEVFEDRGEYAMSGFVGGVVNMEPEVKETMTNAAHSSTEAFALEQMQLIRQFNVTAIPNEAVNAAGNFNNSGNDSNITNPIFNFEYNISGVGSTDELESMLKSRDNDLKGYILDVLEDNENDRQRRSFAY